MPGDNIPESMGEDFSESVGEDISEQAGAIISESVGGFPRNQHAAWKILRNSQFEMLLRRPGHGPGHSLPNPPSALDRCGRRLIKGKPAGQTTTLLMSLLG
jgi:hypothetical protein